MPLRTSSRSEMPSLIAGSAIRTPRRPPRLRSRCRSKGDSLSEKEPAPGRRSGIDRRIDQIQQVNERIDVQSIQSRNVVIGQVEMMKPDRKPDQPDQCDCEIKQANPTTSLALRGIVNHADDLVVRLHTSSVCDPASNVRSRECVPPETCST